MDQIRKLLLVARMMEMRRIALDIIPGGIADRKIPEDFNQEQLEKGIQEEMKEHTNSRQVAQEIAMDHLTEDPNYYKDK